MNLLEVDTNLIAGLKKAVSKSDYYIAYLFLFSKKKKGIPIIVRTSVAYEVDNTTRPH